MNSVFEKALLSLLFYTQNHSFIAHDFFLQNFYPIILFPYFLWKGSESLLTTAKYWFCFLKMSYYPYFSL